MRYYPIFLDIHHAQVLIVGAGAVGLRKLSSLLASAAAHISILDIQAPTAGLPELLAKESTVSFEQRPAQESDITNKTLVFACTSQREINKQIAQWCQEQGILCNSADAPEEGNFIAPACCATNEITLCIGTEAASPALSRHMRKELEKYIANYSPIAALLRALRKPLLELGLATPENTAIFRSLVASPLAAFLAQKKMREASVLLHTVLPQELHPHIGELLHEYQ